MADQQTTKATTWEGPGGVFSLCSFAIVRSEMIPSEDIADMTKQIELHGGQVVVDNYPEERLNLDSLTHIISTIYDFPDYYEAIDRFVQVINPVWVRSSISNNRLSHPRKFTPDPNLIMSEVVATCADLPTGDKDAIAGGILAMGGNYSSKLTSQVTHIVALSTEDEKVQQVLGNDLSMMVVLPHWFDDCLRLGKKIDESPYMLPDPEILRPGNRGPPNKIPGGHVDRASHPHPPGSSPGLDGRKKLKVFKNKRILLDKDLQISELLRNVLNGMILTSDGKVVDKVSEATMLICKYRTGINYTAATTNRIDVGNLAWLYYLIVHDIWTSPFRRLLHYPVPKEPLPGFPGLKISISNYTGEARTYLENLILATGAECTKTLKSENTHLITAHKKSEKVQAAEEWNVMVVNHLWIEESYAKWHMQAVTNTRYTHFPEKTHLGEVIGQTRVDRDVIESKFLPKTNDADKPDAPAGRPRGRPSAAVLNASTPAKANVQTPKITAPPSSVIQTPTTARVLGTGKENRTPDTGRSRKSKDAATAKLHNMTDDIALFEKERKRVGGVVYGGRRKDDPDRVESSRKRSAEPAEVVQSAKKPAKRPRTEPAATQMHLLISSHQEWVNKPAKEREDIKRLRELGIVVVDHPSKASYIAVPRIVRTPKFLIAIAYAPKVLSTDYIEACLEADEYLEPDDFELKDTENEDKWSVILKKSLEKAEVNQRKLLQGYHLYCTEKVTGGYETLRDIAHANGGSLAPYRGRHVTIPSRRTGTDDEDPDNEVYLLTGNSDEEKTKLWPKFVKMAEDSRRTPRVLSGEWLLSCALRQEIEPLNPYEYRV